MKILVTGACGFVGSSLARHIRESLTGVTIVGVDNFIRPGSELNRKTLRELDVTLLHGDVRNPSDLAAVGPVDWVIEAAANPSVLAGVDGRVGSRQLVDHNLVASVNVLEFCKTYGAGFILLSTSRVYSIDGLAGLPLAVDDRAFRLDAEASLPPGATERGIDESFSTTPPLSLYGATKLASEVLALEYEKTFDFPVWVNRCGVLAGEGQFGRADQGIFSFWINSYLRRKPLSYIGFGGKGLQVRDCLHPFDLSRLLLKQIAAGDGGDKRRVVNVSGGIEQSMSLRQLSDWCSSRFGFHEVTPANTDRVFDVPWLILDSSEAEKAWGWKPERPLSEVLDEIALHAEKNPSWLEISNS